MRFVRMGLALGLAIVAISLPTASAQAGCGLLGLNACPPPAAPSSGTAPDPGGDEKSQVPLPPAGGKLFGFNSQLYAWATTPQREVSYELALHANAQRIGASWNAMQPTPSSPPLPDEGGKPVGALNNKTGDLGRLDGIYLELVNHGMKPVIMLGDAPVWASDYANCRLLDSACRRGAASSHLPPAAAHLSDWQRFVAAVVRRYPQAAIQPWNEPNLTPFWGDQTPNSARMASMQCAAFQGAKGVNQATIVLSPALAVFAAPRDDGSPSFQSYLSALYGRNLRGCMNDLSLNLYPANVLDLGAGSPLAQEFQLVRQTRATYGDASPIWITETGSTSFPNHGDERWGISEAQQADLNLRLYSKMMTMGDVHAVLFHSLRNAPTRAWVGQWTEPGYNYGFLREDFSPKPVFCAFAARAGTTYSGC